MRHVCRAVGKNTIQVGAPQYLKGRKTDVGEMKQEEDLKDIREDVQLGPMIIIFELGLRPCTIGACISSLSPRRQPLPQPR